MGNSEEENANRKVEKKLEDNNEDKKVRKLTNIHNLSKT